MEKEKEKETYRRVVTPDYTEQAFLDIGFAAGTFVMCCVLGLFFGMGLSQYFPMALVSAIIVFLRGFVWWVMNRKVTYIKGNESESYY